MNLDEFNELAIANDELMTRLEGELAEALSAREALFTAPVEGEPEEANAATA